MSELQAKDCPCGSGKKYSACCEPFHHGTHPQSALELMRSRYSAYALGLARYIIDTTHPASPQFCLDREQWMKDVEAFCQEVSFDGLEVLGSQEAGNFATVTFVAHLSQDSKDESFTERSYFERVKNRWLYRSGQLSEGHAPNLITTNQLRLLPLAYYDAPVLRRIANRVDDIDDAVRKLAQEMIETMEACDGIGIAAPQVHHSIKMFVMRMPVEKEGEPLKFGGIEVLINPEISESSQETCLLSEGCLSIPTIHADISRPKEITIEYDNLEGKRIKKRLTGWAARIAQHENDHLNGILFIDRLSQDERHRLEPLLQHLKNRIHDGSEL